jgi:hypothetical protein
VILEGGQADAVYDVVKASKDSEAGVMPKDSLIAALTKYNEEMAKAGILLDLAGLQPSSKGARHQVLRREAHRRGRPVRRGEGPDRRLLADPVKSREEAIDWDKRCPSPHGGGREGEIELRQLFEHDDFRPSLGIKDARRIESELAKKKQSNRRYQNQERWTIHSSPIGSMSSSLVLGAGGLPGWPWQRSPSGPSWLFLLLFAAKYQPSLHLDPHPRRPSALSRNSVRREDYGNFSVLIQQ